MIRQKSLSASQIVQLVAIVPVSIFALFGAGMGAIALGGASSYKGGLHGALGVLGLSILPFLAVVCLWVAILSNNVAVAARRRAFLVVWAGLMLGCALAAFLVVAFAWKGRDGGAVVLYGLPFAIGAWHLYRLTRILWLPDPSLERP